MIKT
jgi:hypothetical protein